MTRETAAAHGVPLVDGLLAMHLPQDLTPSQYDELSSAWQSNGARTGNDGWSGLRLRARTGGRAGDGAGPRARPRRGGDDRRHGRRRRARPVRRSPRRRGPRRDRGRTGPAPAGVRLQAAILTTVGAVVGTLLGLLPIRALTLRFDGGPTGTTHLPFVADWPVLALLALGLPLLVTAGTWLTAGRGRRPVVRRAH